MKIDERALEAAYQAVSSTPNDSGDGFMFHDPDDAWRVAYRSIEAYEAARWRPIEEAPRDGTWFDLWLETCSHDPLRARWDGIALDIGGMRWIQEGSPPLEGAMFRTITPPPDA